MNYNVVLHRDVNLLPVFSVLFATCAYGSRTRVQPSQEEERIAWFKHHYIVCKYLFSSKGRVIDGLYRKKKKLCEITEKWHA